MKKTITDEEFYSGLKSLPQIKYPFQDKIHPDYQKAREEYYAWIDDEYNFHSLEAREKHKKHHFVDIVTRGMPFLKSIEEIRPLSVYTANGAMMDDYFDRCTLEEMYKISAQIDDILTGRKPEVPKEKGIFHFYWQLRQYALESEIPETLYKRFVKSMHAVFDAYAEEKTYYRANTTAPLPVYTITRTDTSGVLPYCIYAAVQKEYRKIPDEFFDHPHILRIQTLCAIMIGIHNDIISLPKKLHREGDTMNIVKVMQHDYKLSLRDAYMKSIELHDQYLDEFLILQKNLPFFGDFQNLVSDYVQDLGIMIAGVYKWHTADTTRYVNGGYAEGEYVSK